MSQNDIFRFLKLHKGTWYNTRQLKKAGFNVCSSTVCKQLKQLAHFKVIERKAKKMEWPTGGYKDTWHYRVK